MVLASPGQLLTPSPSSSPPKTPIRSYSAQTPPRIVAAKASALRINLNIQGCSVVAPSLHAPSHTTLLLPLLLSHNLPLPRVH
jgi:hypothetical protein